MANEHGRKRRMQSDIGSFKKSIHSLLAVDQPMTARQLFYRTVTFTQIEKAKVKMKPFRDYLPRWAKALKCLQIFREMRGNK